MEKQVNVTNPENWLALYGDLMYQYTLPRVKGSEVAVLSQIIINMEGQFYSSAKKGS
jgi:hypothetical protein